MSKRNQNTAEVLDTNTDIEQVEATAPVVSEASEVLEEPSNADVDIDAIHNTVGAPSGTVAKIYDINQLFDERKTKSSVIRFLSAEGLKVGAIHKLLVAAGVKNTKGTDAIRYQHVRNVLVTPLKKA